MSRDSTYDNDGSLKHIRELGQWMLAADAQGVPVLRFRWGGGSPHGVHGTFVFDRPPRLSWKKHTGGQYASTFYGSIADVNALFDRTPKDDASFARAIVGWFTAGGHAAAHAAAHAADQHWGHVCAFGNFAGI